MPKFTPPTVLVESHDPASAEPYSYKLGRGCTTGRHTYETLAEVCGALLDDELNNDCAKNERDHLYETSCTEV